MTTKLFWTVWNDASAIQFTSKELGVKFSKLGKLSGFKYATWEKRNKKFPLKDKMDLNDLWNACKADWKIWK